MTSFDILSKEVELKPRLFLEASAGTGKTFTIEHLVMRLLLETPLQLEEIVVVTFTKAATRELKDRIRCTLEGADTYPYLEGISDAQRAKLALARQSFESAKIFTLHGFCSHLLSRFPLEAGASLHHEEWSEEEISWEIKQFLRKKESLSPGQFRRLCATFQYDMGKLEKSLRAASKIVRVPSAEQLLDEVNNNLPAFFAVSEEFASVRASYKGMTASAFAEQAAELQEALANRKVSESVWNRWIAAPQFCLKNLEEANLKVRAKTAVSECLSNLRTTLWPRLAAAQNRRHIFAKVSAEWLSYWNALTQKKEKVTPDDLLQQVHAKLQEPLFVSAVRKQYRAIIVDEFQDTDPLQWEIMKTIFLDDPLVYAYLVGDPKQSIYAFRKADLYTFLDAATTFEHTVSLSRNFRASSQLLLSLNTLLTHSSPWMDIPKRQASLPVPEAIAAKEGDGELVFMVAEGEKGRSSTWPTPAIENEQLFPFIVETLQKRSMSAAILVKDRYQAARVKRFLESWGIPTALQRLSPLATAPAIAWLEEVADSFLTEAGLRKFLLGPFMHMGMHELTPDALFQAKKNLQTLESLWEKGFAAVFAKLKSWENDDLLELVQRAAFVTTPYALRALLQEIREHETADRIAPTSSEGVAIMTIHASKGLEFETVFALALASRSPEQDLPEDELKELDAEKMRQLYVALTRAKVRLYVPVAHEIPAPSYVLGEGSPMELFVERAKPDLSAFKQERLKGRQFQLQRWEPPAPEKRRCVAYKPTSLKVIQSFSSLAHDTFESKKGETQALAPGIETGVLVHRILERIFNREGELQEVVRQEVSHSHLAGKEADIEALLQRTLECCIEGMSLNSVLQTCSLQTEMEFCYETEHGWMKGYIDLCFEHGGKLYVIDWKTNLIEGVDLEALKRVMQAHDYFLQGEIYARGMEKYLAHFPQLTFGGVYFVFVRGPAVIALQTLP